MKVIHAVHLVVPLCTVGLNNSFGVFFVVNTIVVEVESQCDGGCTVGSKRDTRSVLFLGVRYGLRVLCLNLLFRLYARLHNPTHQFEYIDEHNQKQP